MNTVKWSSLTKAEQVALKVIAADPTDTYAIMDEIRTLTNKGLISISNMGITLRDAGRRVLAEAQAPAADATGAAGEVVDEDTIIAFANDLKRYPNEPVLNLWEKHFAKLDDQQAELTRLRSDLAAAREALKPFSEIFIAYQTQSGDQWSSIKDYIDEEVESGDLWQACCNAKIAIQDKQP